MKRTLTLLLALLMILSLGNARAQDATYTTLYSGEVTTLNYLTTATTNEFAVAANVIDTLVEYDRLGQVQPSLAEDWKVSEDGLTWTFYLRKDAQWVNGAGEPYAEVKADDFVAAAQYILDAANASSTADILYSVVDGAEAYYQGTATPEEGEEPAPEMPWETVGIKALDDYTLEYQLNSPIPYFLSMTTYVCFMPVNRQFLEEKGAGFGLATGNDTILYNGAYVLSEFKPQEKRVYTKNAVNWDADNVLIETIEQLYNKEATTLSPELYQRGEIDEASIDSAIANEWLSNPETADLIRPVRQSGFYTYFYALNFRPEFDASYEPENWKIAVNNENFRLSIAAGLDRLKAMLVIEPDNPEAIIFNTITPPNFVNVNGLDYVNIGELARITEQGLNTFNAQKALEHRDLAKEELVAAGAALPIKVLMSYNPAVTSWAEECQVVEQQLEELLGSDYIDIIVEAGPSSGFLSAVRRAGQYALLKCNWGPDYADPETYTDPFSLGGTYNFIEFAEGYTDADGNKTYNNLVDAAKAITGDLMARYEAFAKAEAFLIDHAFVIPFGYGSGGYVASRLNPFESQYAPFGLSNERYKGQSLLEEPMNTDRYFDAYDQWLADRDALAQGN
ncbi:MAG: peptide ABC transporter substrate-binding protein [Eubacteriales bacterium]|nr:peptide ABC transporter substrate-binding protein [Eubacteriales bacterium]MDD4134184.1 peptide ABC transporter substrate-binding protein [Eubacteriales bacterium]